MPDRTSRPGASHGPGSTPVPASPASARRAAGAANLPRGEVDTPFTQPVPTGETPDAIRPYPTQYVEACTLPNGSVVTIRPIRPEDEPMMVAFHESLSDRSVYLRYFHMMRLDMRVSHERLRRICFVDYDRDMALVAEGPDEHGAPRIAGVGRLTRQRETNAGEFAIIVRDDRQGQGLGTALLRRLVRIGRDMRLDRITADILPENLDMQRVSRKVGFTCAHDIHAGVVKAVLDLVRAPDEG
jgi:acetyltransferase